ncbi:hypothetical protein DL991_42065 [Amycolatopsis sp. WAC 01375]|nr:hypothetical protein DL991_42065 [Amycolatopsis sp. WAC 01375]
MPPAACWLRIGMKGEVWAGFARPSTGRQTSGRDKIHRELPRDVSAAQRPFSGKIASWAETGREITQIYEGTNQIQRMVMARALLKG